MKKLLVLLLAALAAFAAAPATAQTYTFTITETTGGTNTFFASFQLSGAPNFDDGNTIIEFNNVQVTFASGTRTVDFVAFYDSPDGGLTFYDDNQFLFSSTSVFDQQAFERGPNGNFSKFYTNANYRLQGDQNFTGRTFSLSISQAVPEPDTWAMMILGFGLAGYALRRKRRGEPGNIPKPELQFT